MHKPPPPRHLLTPLAAGLASLLAAPIMADEQQPNKPEEVFVTATRTDMSPNLVGSSVSVISRLDIERTGARQVMELFSRVPGLYAFETGGYGGTTSVRLRGAADDQTLVLIDGVRVNDPGSAQGAFDFSTLLLTDIERIEIVRGPQSALWGGDAIGGVINIITRRGEGKPSGKVELQGGSFNTWKAGASVRGGTEDYDFSLSGSALTSDGFSRVREDLGATEDDGTDSWTLNGRGGVKVTPIWRSEAVFQASHVDAETDPSLAGAVDGDASSERTVLSGRLTQLLASEDSKTSHEITVFGQRTEREFFDATDTIPFSNFDSSSLGAEYLLRTSFEPVGLVGGLRTQREDGSGSRSGGGQTIQQFDETFDTQSVFAQADWAATEQLNLTFGGRYDDFEIGGGHTTWRTTLSQGFEKTGTRLRASYGTGAKPPTIYQSFFNGPEPIFGTILIGNPNLDVEESEGFDISLEQSFAEDRWFLSATYYQQDIDNLIQFVVDFATFTSTYENIDKVETDGWEFEANWDASESLRITANYTITNAIDASNGLSLPRTPEDQGSLRIDWTAGQAYVGAQATYVGKQFNRSRERDPLDSFVRVDVDARWTLNERSELFARIENLFDEDYEVVRNAAVADLSAYLGVRARW